MWVAQTTWNCGLQSITTGQGANYTKHHQPVELVYYEQYDRVDDAFYREKQIQGWTRKKKEALIEGKTNLLSPTITYYHLLSPLAKKVFHRSPAAE